MKRGYVGKGYGNLLITVRRGGTIYTRYYPNCCMVYRDETGLLFTENNTPHFIPRNEIHSYSLE